MPVCAIREERLAVDQQAAVLSKRNERMPIRVNWSSSRGHSRSPRYAANRVADCQDATASDWRTCIFCVAARLAPASHVNVCAVVAATARRTVNSCVIEGAARVRSLAHVRLNLHNGLATSTTGKVTRFRLLPLGRKNGIGDVQRIENLEIDAAVKAAKSRRSQAGPAACPEELQDYRSCPSAP